MRFLLHLATLAMAVVFLAGCGDDTEKTPAESGERPAAQENASRPAEENATLAVRNASEALQAACPPEFVGPLPMLDSPPEFIGPLPHEDSPPEFVGPLPPHGARVAEKAPACPVEPVQQAEEHPAPAADAAKAKAEVDKKVVGKPQVAAKAPNRPHPKAKGPAPETLAQAEEHFRRFAGDWVDSVSNNLLHTARDMQVVEKDGGYLARFVHVEEESLSSAVRRSEVASCPWVGTLRYIVAHYENFCATPECARNGPFDCVKRVRNTEIFRFHRGSWAD